jgi:predicted dehydrogenase
MGPLHRRDFTRTFGGAALSLAAAGLAPAGEGPRKDRIKVGQVGVGHGHATKLAAYRLSADYEVVGVAEPDPELRKRAEPLPAYKGLPWMTREQLLNVPGLRAVLVETRVRDLLDNAEACVAAGLHVHVDKPAGESLAQLRRLLDAAAKKGLLVQVGYMYRYNPAVALLRQFLKKGWLGEPFEAHAVMSKVVPPEGRRELAAYPGGILFELGCHVIDLLVGLLGPPREVSAFPLHSARVDDKLRDNMLAVFTYPRATASVRSSAMEVEGFERRHLVVCGTEGTFHIQPLDNPSARVALGTARGGYKRGYQDVRFDRFERYVADAADMARVIRGEKEADFAAAHDLAVQEALLKACGLPARP